MPCDLLAAGADDEAAAKRLFRKALSGPSVRRAIAQQSRV